MLPYFEALIVDAGGGRGATLQSWLRGRGWHTRRLLVQNHSAIRLPVDPPPRVLLLDCGEPTEAYALLEVLQRDATISAPVIVLDASGTVHGAVEAMHRGATDYLAGPIGEPEVMDAIESASRLETQQQAHRSGVGPAPPENLFGRLVGNSPAIRKCIAQAKAARGNLSNVLLIGESGTGKELIARGIHFHGIRRHGPYSPVNCAAIPRELIEGELFGYTRGAFSGAVRDNPGLLRGSAGGTIFLDELTEMSTQSQAKLLRVIQERVVRPLGTQTEVPIDVRVIAATNRELGEAIEQGRLRRDLYYRLSVVPIHLPPLRERLEDLPLLLQHLTDRLENQFGTLFPGFSVGAIEALQRHPWPGNVRELENLVEGFFALETDQPIRAAMVAERLSLLEEPVGAETLADLSLATMEKKLIWKAMERTGGDKASAAEILGISRMTLYRKLKEMG